MIKKVAVYITDSCKTCPYTTEVQRKYGKTISCNVEVSHMDVTNCKGRSALCPLRAFE